MYVLSCIFRPQVLVLTGFPCVRPELLYFVNALTKKISLMVCGHIIVVSLHVSVTLWKTLVLRVFVLQACSATETS